MRAQKRGPSLFISGLLFTFVFLAGGSPPFVSKAGDFPRWWEMTLDLKTDGEYKIEGVDGTFKGQYTLAIRWLGCMERDDHDYLLYNLDSELRKWDAHESASSPGAESMRTRRGFRDKPSFDFKYIFRKGEELHLDFLVTGIPVPQSDSEDSFLLLFPSSEENDQHDFQVAYNAFVAKGSNRDCLGEAEIYSGPVAKKYSWAWKHQQWILKQQRTVFAAQAHRVEVVLSVIPHFAPPKKK